VIGSVSSKNVSGILNYINLWKYMPIWYMCSAGGMKRRDLEEQLRKLGWKFLRHGGRHDVWTNGIEQEAIPRHNEINEFTAKKILKKAKENPCR
jgi:mRNA interferase HicA